jgi:4Fe-4S ferredoxin
MAVEKPKLELIILDNILTYEWKAPELSKQLNFYMEKCTACGLCKLVCPVDAISLGPVTEVAAGKFEAPLIVIDETKCVACPLCSSVCFFEALKLEFEEKPQYPQIKGEIKVDLEKCIPCLLCEKICPRNAVKVDIKVPKKEELVKYEDKEWAKGKISIDVEKCSFCGLCELLCDAVKITWVDPQPPEYKPGITISVEENSCDYCGLCEKICPSDAIKVECTASAPRKIGELKIEGSLVIDDEKCVWCGICAKFCPTEAIQFAKPLLGKAEILKPEKCDPSGCKNCMNICPVNVIYVPRKPVPTKILIVEDFCIFCGACENACPEGVIKISREKYFVKSSDKLWTMSYQKFFDKILEGYVPLKPPLYVRPVQVPIEMVELPPPEAIPPKPKGFEKAKKIANELIEKLRTKVFRILFERGKIDRLKGESKSGE